MISRYHKGKVPRYIGYSGSEPRHSRLTQQDVESDMRSDYRQALLVACRVKFGNQRGTQVYQRLLLRIGVEVLRT